MKNNYKSRGRQNRSWKGKKTKMQWINLSPKELRRLTDMCERVKFLKEEITAKISLREEAGNWTFVYMGADQDAWSVASNLGFAQGNVMSYASASTAASFNNLASSTTATSCSASTQTRGFFTGGN